MMSSGGPSMAKPGKRRVADDHTAADAQVIRMGAFADPDRALAAD